MTSVLAVLPLLVAQGESETFEFKNQPQGNSSVKYLTYTEEVCGSISFGHANYSGLFAAIHESP